MKKQSISYLLIAILTLLTVWFAHSSDYEKYFEMYDIPVQLSVTIDIAFPEQPSLDPETHGSAPDLSTLVSVKLVDPVDHDADAYVYFPKLEIIAPIVSPSSSDQKKIFFGESFNHFKYLEEWVLHYYWDSPRYGESNMVLAAHSSFRKSDNGRYRTIFQVVPLLRDWDEVHYYEKNTKGTYDFYIYQVDKSFETDEYDVSILRDEWKSILTAYTCREFGTTDKRWVIQAHLMNSILDYEELVINKPESAKTTVSTVTPALVEETIDGIKNTYTDQDIEETSKVIQKPTSHGVASSVEPSSQLSFGSNGNQVVDTTLDQYAILTSKLIEVDIPVVYKQQHQVITTKIERINMIYTLRHPGFTALLQGRISKKITSLLSEAKQAEDQQTVIDKLIMLITIYQALNAE